MKHTRHLAAVLLVTGSFLGVSAQTNTFPASGNVGVGTTNPLLLNGSVDRLLSVEGPNYAGLAIRSTNVGGRQYLWYTDNAGVFFLYDATAGANRLFVNSSGNLGIGTYPQRRLHVYDNTGTSEAVLIEGTAPNGYTQASFKGTGRQWQIGVGNAGETGLGVANKFYIYDAGSSAMRLTIDTAGSVGINGNDLTLVGGAPTTVYRDTDGKTGYWHVNSNIMYLLSAPQGSGYGAWTQVNGRWPLEVNLTNNNAQFGGSVGGMQGVFGASAPPTDAIVNAGTNNAAYSTAFHGYVVSNNGIGALLDVSNAANTWNNDILVMRRMTNGGVAPAVGLANSIAFTLDAGSAASHAPQLSGRITSVMTATNGTNNSAALTFSTSNVGTVAEKMRITPAGYVGIGTAAPTHLLSVRGQIRAQEIIVDNTSWADFVFDEGYRLQPLAEVETHIKARKHLPGIPSAAEVAEEGVSLGEMQAKLLQKIEELVLHQIAQEKRLDSQAERIAALEKENAALRAR